MSAVLSQEAPAAYIRHATEESGRVARGLAASQYREHLVSLLEKSCPDAGNVFMAFLKAAQLNQSLKSTFYAAINDGFGKLRLGTKDVPQRWNTLMMSIKDVAEKDPTVLKFVRETLLAKSVPVLVGPQSSPTDLQVASDILTVAGTSPQLADALRPEWLKPVVMWHFANAGHNFICASGRFKMLRESPPFDVAVTDFEIKHDVHVDSEALDHDPNKKLVVQFKRGHDNITIAVIDFSKPGRSRHPHEIEFIGAETPHIDKLSKILERSTELPRQKWVGEIATELYCSIG